MTFTIPESVVWVAVGAMGASVFWVCFALWVSRKAK